MNFERLINLPLSCYIFSFLRHLPAYPLSIFFITALDLDTGRPATARMYLCVIETSTDIRTDRPTNRPTNLVLILSPPITGLINSVRLSFYHHLIWKLIKMPTKFQGSGSSVSLLVSPFKNSKHIYLQKLSFTSW